MKSRIAALMLLALGSAGALAAGTVTVSFINSDKYADAGNSRSDTPRTLKTLEDHLRQLGERYLAEGQSLSIEVLDVDLAGEMRPSRRTATQIRVVRGGADWPRLKVRYVLEGAGQAAQRGEESIADLAYQSQISRYTDTEPLHYEKQMLESWFKAKFAPAH